MDAADKRMLEREALRNMIQQWNANRLDLFALSEPNENLEFHGVMRFYFQDSGQKIATKCIRVASDATVSDVIETLIEKFRPDMRMLSLGSYSLWETHGPDDERKLEPHEKPLLVQLNWHADDREGRFLLKCLSNNEVPLSAVNDKGDQNFKRKLSKREKKELKKKEKLSRLKSDTNDENRPVAEKLYTELPETSFMRSISNPEAVMRRRRQQKLGRKLQQFKSKDGGPDTGGTLRVYGSILRPDVSYVTLLLSVNDSAATVLRETLDKYGMSYQDPSQFCIVQEDKTDNSEYILEDDECPLALMNMTRSSIMFHVRRRPADVQPRRRKKKVGSGTGTAGGRPGNDPMLVEMSPDATVLENGRRLRITDVVEVGSGNGTTLQLYGPSIQPRHCVVAPAEGGGYNVTPLHADAHVYVNGRRIMHSQRLQHGCLLKFGRVSTFRFVDPAQENLINRNLAQSQHFGSGSIYDRMSAGMSSGRGCQEAILPAVLEFPEAGQAQFLAAVITRLDPHAPAFKLAPVYTLYLCARYRASTHYRPELTPTERAHKLTAFLHHVATLIHATVQERCTDSAAQAFWMTNASELLHFLKYDRHISSFSTQAQEVLSLTVQNAFSNLVTCFQEELSRGLATLTSAAVGDANEATAPTLQALAAAIVLLRRCRVNAALTIQLFSHLFHYINAVCFNKLVTEPGMVSARWGAALSARLKVLAAWAERQGLELAAECHFARMNQAARLIQGEYRTADEAVAALKACFKLNSVQTRALLTPLAPPDVVEAGVAYVRTHTDELYRADGRDIRLEESSWLGAGLLIPSDGFSAEVVCGVPPGLAEFVAPLQRGGLCRLAHQPHALGVWTVYMCGHATSAARRAPDPRLHIIQLHKNSNGMGLSIVAAKGAGQTKLGIYIKSVVPGGAAAADGRLAAGDQLLSVDGQSLVGITQEKAAEYLVRTGPTVTLEVAKQGAMLHGLATLLHQPAYNQRQVEEVQYEDRSRRNSGTFTNPHPALLRPASPRTELATAGYGRRPCHNRCHFLKDESTESSTDESEEWQPHYHGSIPRLIVTLDRENNQLQDDLSPDTPGCPLELRADAPPPRPIPVFTFTCEDFDEQQPSGDSTTGTQAEESPQHPPRFDTPPEEPPPVPDPPANYDQSSDNGDSICLPPQMEPIDTKLTLDLFNARSRENEFYRRRCTGIDECVSACECCRTPQPETQQIPYIDEPNSEPLIFENEGPPNKVATPKIRRILPSLSLDQSDSEKKPETADAVCQTPSSPMEVKRLISTPKRKLELNLDIKKDYDQMDNIQCRLKRAIFSMSTSFSGKSEDTEIPSTYSTSDSFDETTNEVKCDVGTVKAQTPAEPGAKQILDSVDRKSWKSPDEYRPSFGKVKELTKHFNDINLKYCVKIYKRNCQSSPNLSVRDKTTKVIENLPASASLADIQYEFNKTDTSETKCEKLSDDEVKSILIQLEDWSKYGSRGSEDTLAHGNEFEIPNLPSEEHTDNTANGYVFNEIIDKKPRRITLDNIRLKSNQSSMNSDQTKQSKESVIVSEASSEKGSSNHLPRVVAMIPQSQSSLAASCPDISAAHTSSGAAGAGVAGGGVRRASERDLPARLAAEASVKSSKSTPALHHAPPEPAPAHHHTPVSVAVSPAAASVSPSAWPSKSRSSHNLSAPTQHDGFYQNLSTVQSQQHALQDRWSSLRSSTGSNRPQSAHFMAGGQAEAPDSPLHHQNVASARAAKLAEMSEEVSRRQMAYHAAQQQHAQQQHAQQPQHGQPQHHHLMGQPQLQMSGGGYGPQSPHPLHQSQPMLHVHNQSPHQIYHNQHHPPQRYEWMPPGPPSPQRSQPPVAPKPQGARRTDMEMEEQLHQHAQSQHPQSQHAQSQHAQSQHAQSQHAQSQHPQSQHLQSHLQQQQPPLNSVQPEDERYVASALEPPAVSVYPAGGGAAGAGRGAAPHNPWQREERERQHEARRAQARARRDATIAQLLSLGAARTPVQNQQLRALQLERDFELRATQHDQEEGNAAEGSEEPEEMQDELPSSPPAASPAPPLTAAPPPKSILKTNTRTTEITNGYTTEQVTYEETRVSEVSSAVSALSVSSSTHTLVGGAASAGGAGPGAPPPPLRGSSFAVMAERARTLSPPRHDQHAHAQHNAISVAPQSPVGSARDKRVSFHERAAPPAPPASSPPPLHEPPQPAREDPDRFIEEAESMLAGPVSPQTNNAPNMPQHTPGVIGAQEVYRDPRARRLAEQQARAPSAPVPEQLSFKEKMKMFALESGEASTPKDKVKISRAQRDIDAVH